MKKITIFLLSIFLLLTFSISVFADPHPVPVEKTTCVIVPPIEINQTGS
ncbi:MAG: hypothetical protein KAX49_20215 [Halanaerobiales bacterium]|nr:hypothetical protein [Halanaerobiales bacterium]